jgi:GTPase SAR1 family protein
MIGIGNVGKSSLVQHWIGEPSSTPLPTVGLEIHRMVTDNNLMLTFFGLGGNDNLRGYWNNYYESAHAITIVVPANSNTYENDSYWNTLQYELDDEILMHPYVQGKPVIIVCNSFVAPNSTASAVSSKDISKRLDLERHSNVHYVDCCVAPTESGFSDVGAMEGLQYVINAISQNWSDLDTRVRRDVEISKTLRKEQMQKLKERIQCEKVEECKEEATFEPETY